MCLSRTSVVISLRGEDEKADTIYIYIYVLENDPLGMEHVDIKEGESK